MSAARTFSTRRARGFTLLEILIATTIAAIVLLVINATFFSALRLHDTTHARIDQDLLLQRALGIIRGDLAGIMLPGSTTTTTLAGQFQTDTAMTTTVDSSGGERVSPDIYTSSGRVDGWTSFSDVQIVSYYLVPDTSPTANGNPNAKDLVRVVTRNLLPVDDEPSDDDQVLLTGVTAATMLYFDGSDWTDTWDSTATSTLPNAIKFSLTLVPRGNNTSGVEPPPIDLVVPVIVATTTSAQLAATGGTSATLP